MSKIKIFLISLAIIFASAGVFVVVSFVRVQSCIDKDFGQAGAAKEFIITPGEKVKEISERLKDENLISSAFCFQIYVWQKNAGGKIQAGEYEIPTGINIPQVFDMLVGGKINPDDVWITIPEGFNSQQIVAKFQISNFKFQNNFKNLISNASKELSSNFWFLSEGKSLEGYLFPDTYKFDKDVAAEDIIEKMLSNFAKKVDPLRGKIENNKMNLYEIVTLASVVEKEVASSDDMRIVAGIFLKRMEIGMPLQSDATVNYVTQKGDPTPLYKDLEIDSPYNTYKYKGLPAGPICNPGLNAIEAVLNPQKTDYLYFLTPVDQPTVFSKTFAEHQASSRKWLK